MLIKDHEINHKCHTGIPKFWTFNAWSKQWSVITWEYWNWEPYMFDQSSDHIVPICCNTTKMVAYKTDFKCDYQSSLYWFFENVKIIIG